MRMRHAKDKSERMTENSKENNQMNRTQTTISVRHVSISIEKTFSETCSRFESRMGRIDYAAFEKMLREGESETTMGNYVKGIEGAARANDFQCNRPWPSFETGGQNCSG